MNNPLWNSYREIISYGDSEFDHPTPMSDLRRCENVIVGNRVCPGGPYEVLTDDHIYTSSPVKLQRPIWRRYNVKL